MTTTRIIVADVRDALASLPAASVHCAVTSPPYWGLRDYGVAGQIGLEPTVDEWVEAMVDVFRAVRRVLRDDGTLWLNLGDSYCASAGDKGWTGERLANGRGDQPAVLRRKAGASAPAGKARPAGLKPKDLIGQPWRVAFALQADGWWLRSACIWHKPNPMPESIEDRPTSSHEYVFLLAKSQRYFYDADAVREPCLPQSVERAKYGGRVHPKGWHSDSVPISGGDNDGLAPLNEAGRNLRTVWTIPSEPFPGAHFATYPTKLVEPCVKAGTSERGCCPACGGPWMREVDVSGGTIGKSWHDHANDLKRGQHDEGRAVANGFKTYTRTTTGWSPSCECETPGALFGRADPIPCTVLDPFGGSGTTALVANRLGRDAILCELNPEYAAMAAERIRASVGGMFNTVAVESPATSGGAA